MNSYGTRTLARGHHKTANGPYGSPRGNPAMASKRTTGPTAQAKLCASVAHEPQCSITIPGTGTVRKWNVESDGTTAVRQVAGWRY